MKTFRNRLTRVIAVVLVALALTPTGAGAIDVRSWDQRIENVNQRFVVLNAFENQAVLDKETQLVWERTPSPNVMNYQLQVEHCLHQSTGDRGGWRVPTVHELKSLLMSGGALPGGHPFNLAFPGADPRVWSSTKNTVFDGTVRFYAVQLGDFHPHTHYPPTQELPVWCVRGPAADGAGY